MWIESFSEQSFINFDKVISIKMITDKPNSERITVTTEGPDKEEIELITIEKARKFISSTTVFNDEQKKKINGKAADVILSAFLAVLMRCLTSKELTKDREIITKEYISELFSNALRD